jgi:hypothetical protein
MSRIQFAAKMPSGKRSFTLRPGSIVGKTISLMSTIPEFVLFDPENGK